MQCESHESKRGRARMLQLEVSQEATQRLESVARCLGIDVEEAAKTLLVHLNEENMKSGVPALKSES